jgi:hypothetical protein
MNYKMIDRLVIQTNAKGDKVQQTQRATRCNKHKQEPSKRT